MQKALNEHFDQTKCLVYGIRVVLLPAGLLLAVIGVIRYIQSSSTAFANWVLLLGLLACAAVNYLIRRDVLYPAFMFSTVWSLVSTVYAFFPFEIDPISWTTVCIILGGTLCFSIGCLVGSRPFSNRPAWFTSKAQNTQPRRMLLLYSIIAVPLVAYSAMRTVGMYSLSPAFFIALRNVILADMSEGVMSYNIFINYAPTIATSTAFILLMEESNRFFLATGIVSAVVLGVLTTGRPILLLLFCGWIMLALLRKRNRSMTVMAKQMAAMALAVAFALTLVPLLTKNETQKENSGDKSGLEIAGGLTAMYVAGPLAAFDHIVRHPEVLRGETNNVFAEIIPSLRTFGFRFNYPPRETGGDFVPVPFAMNAYTAYKDFYLDFGVMGCFVGFLVVGFITGQMFFAAQRGNQLAMFFFIYLFYAMLFTIFFDGYQSLNRFIYMITFGLIYFVGLRRLPRIDLVLARRGTRA